CYVTVFSFSPAKLVGGKPKTLPRGTPFHLTLISLKNFRKPSTARTFGGVDYGFSGGSPVFWLSSLRKLGIAFLVGQSCT
ncbi:MAG: hypothetical protein QXG11_05335, partial [Candidatus Bathyarchaeia archaeon]